MMPADSGGRGQSRGKSGPSEGGLFRWSAPDSHRSLRVGPGLLSWGVVQRAPSSVQMQPVILRGPSGGMGGCPWSSCSLWLGALLSSWILALGALHCRLPLAWGTGGGLAGALQLAGQNFLLPFTQARWLGEAGGIGAASVRSPCRPRLSPQPLLTSRPEEHGTVCSGQSSRSLSCCAITLGEAAGRQAPALSSGPLGPRAPGVPGRAGCALRKGLREGPSFHLGAQEKLPGRSHPGDRP